MAKKPSAAVAAKAATAKQPAPSKDKLDAIRTEAEKARVLEARIANGQALLEQLTKEYGELVNNTIPALMEAVQMKSFDLSKSRDGKYPACKIELKPYYRANIAASWDADRRQKAFAWLEKNGHGDLIKTEVAVFFPREERKAVKGLVATIKKMKLDPELHETVPAQTLGAWLKEEIEVHKRMPPLSTIGGSIGKVAKLSVFK